ncbi:MAG: peptidylprolyl isomerase [Chloroflexota bacterium]|nr:peptidylprolyl isomerase [Chloroflexota bacterium]
MARKIYLLLMIALLCAACGGSPTETMSGTAAAQSALATTPPPVPTAQPVLVATPLPLPTADGEALVARVNGQPITLESFRRMVARFQAEPSLRSDPEGLRAVVMRTLIEQVLIEQEAAKIQIAVNDAELDVELARLIASSGGETSWTTWLGQNQYTPDEFRALLRATLLTNRMRDHVTRELTAPIAQVHARHILVATRDEAAALLVRLRNGEDFSALAVAVSLDTSTRATGGDLGWFLRDELLEPELARIAFELQPNQIAGPVGTQLGYHIIQTLESEVRPIADDKRAILAQTRFEQWLTDLTTSAAIEQFI